MERREYGRSGGSNRQWEYRSGSSRGSDRGSDRSERSGGDSGYKRPENVPVEEGKTYQIKIEGLGKEGDGIGRVNGFVVIVPGTSVGQTVDVKITKVARKVAFGEVSGSAAPSPKGDSADSSEEE